MQRALVTMLLSVIAITSAGVAYVHPSMSIPDLGAAARPAAVLERHYQIAALDFVNPSTGWVVAMLGTGGYALLHTGDGGRTWSQQLTGTAGPHAAYMKFFDPSNGVFALLGTRPALYKTFDGGHSWLSATALSRATSVVSWSFTDPAHGWMLVSPAELFRTEDGGISWTDLGQPVKAPDQAFRIAFQNQFTGWLDSVSAGPYAYRSEDSGQTWDRVPLPSPAAGWPRSRQFFIAAHPTHQAGLVVAVATFAPVTRRSGIGGTVVLYPPLTMRTFDGGVPVTYSYGVFTEQLTNGNSVSLEQRPGPDVVWSAASNQVELCSVDGGFSWQTISPPSGPGAVGFYDAWNWWWVGAGAWAQSKDGGATWTGPRKIGAIEPQAGSLQVIDSTHAWFASATVLRPVLETTDDGAATWHEVVLPPVEDRPSSSPQPAAGSMSTP